MEKKSLLFMLPAMRMGGAEKIALSFLNELVKYYKITVCLNSKEGELLSELPQSVSCIEDPIQGFKGILYKDLKSIRIGELAKDLHYYIRVKQGKDNEKDYRYIVSKTPDIKERYDIAIAYVGNVSTQVFSLADRVNSEIKIAWIHGETNDLKDTGLFESIYSTFDMIYCVSEVSRNHFVDRFPSCELITDVFYNPIRREEILEKSKEPVDCHYSNECVNILSVGRISPEKGFDMVPQIIKLLKSKGHNVSWYLIGDGPESSIIETKANEMGVKDSLIFLGTKHNPYPYMAGCDIYVQPSYEEGYSTTICEAAILGKAIVGTKTSGGIYEQVEDGVSAILADPNPEAIADAVKRLIEDVGLRHYLEEHARQKNFTHTGEINKLLDFIGKDR